jgi:glycerol-3-phosphate dehydrogenase
MAEVLGWPDQRVEEEVDRYRGRVAAERESQRQDDDRAADAVRLEGPDALTGVPGDT